MKIIYTGPEGSGKSYQLALAAGVLVERNAKWLKKTRVPRPIVSNLHFEPWFERFAKDRGVPIKYWKDLEVLPALTECDLLIDEVGAYFDSRTFKDLPLDVRLWLAQADKLGVDIFGTAQDFAQVDVSFRRLISGQGNALYLIDKIAGSTRPSATKPKVKRVWGVCTMREIDPVGYDESTKKFANKGLPKFFFIRKEICSIFDTNLRIAKSKPPPLKHVERHCVDPNCRLERNKVIDGVHYVVQHV